MAKRRRGTYVYRGIVAAFDHNQDAVCNPGGICGLGLPRARDGRRPSMEGRPLSNHRNGNPAMIRNRAVRRTVALVLVVLGGLLMMLAPPIWIGAIPFVLGVLLEVVGIALEHGGGA